MPIKRQFVHKNLEFEVFTRPSLGGGSVQEVAITMDGKTTSMSMAEWKKLASFVRVESRARKAADEPSV